MSDNSSLENLAKKLDSGTVDGEIHRSALFSRSPRAPKGWQSEGTGGATPVRRRSRRRMPEMLFAGAVAFFFVAIAVAGIILFAGNNTISTKNVDVQVTGPTEIGAGSTLSLQVVITNRNAVPMELTDLIVEFPTGTRSDTDISRDLPRVRESLGTIKPGESVNRTIRAVVFGESGQDVSIKASAEYRVPSSNAIFVSGTTYVAKINQSPVSITVDALKEAVSGQEVTLTVSVVSNAPGILSDMLLVANYPPGFSFKSSKPDPAVGTASWVLGDIESGGRRVIEIKGTFTGEDGESRVLRFNTGTKKENQNDAILVPLAASELSITVTKPFVSVALSLEGSTADTHTITRGKEVRGEVRWTNNLPVKVQNVAITLSLDGSILDRTEVKAQNGFYSSNNSQILWSKATDSNLADVAPGDSETLSFSFNTLPMSNGTFKNPSVHLVVNVQAERQSESNVPVIVKSSAVTDAVVATDVALSATMAHAGGPSAPKADTETTYSVVWVVSSSANALANASVSAVLPSYVRFIAGTAGSNISFSASGRVVTWTIGDIAGGQSKNGSFQVALTPSLSQVGNRPNVVGSQRVSAYDRFVRGQIESTAPPLTTDSVAGAPNGGLVVP
ncbi:MAG: hypothetical protein V4449_00200 [Patescibacteria group bacterium]